MPNEKPSSPETTEEKRESARDDPSNLELPKILRSLGLKFPHLRNPLSRSADFIEGLVEEANRLDSAYRREAVDVEQSLGRALGYPWYMDDPDTFPDATEESGVCVGEHVPGTIAKEAAGKIWKWRTFVRLADLRMTLQNELIKVLNQLDRFHKQGRFTQQSYDRLKRREKDLVGMLEENKKELAPLLDELKETNESQAELQKGKGPGEDVQGAPV